MADGFAQELSDWTPFYAGLAGVAATLLGLVFVSVSLRLNLFHDAAVADVRDFAALVFGQYLALVLLGLVALIPEASPAALGAPMLALGMLGLGWGIRVAVEYLQLNRTPGSRTGWSFALYGLSLLGTGALAVVGVVLLLRRDAAVLPWAAAAELVTLLAASVGAWVLLSHAQSS